MSSYFGRLNTPFGRSVYFTRGENTRAFDQDVVQKAELGDPITVENLPTGCDYQNQGNAAKKLDVIQEVSETTVTQLAAESDYALDGLNLNHYATPAVTKEAFVASPETGDDSPPPSKASEASSHEKGTRPREMFSMPQGVRMNMGESMYVAPIANMQLAFSPHFYNSHTSISEIESVKIEQGDAPAEKAGCVEGAEVNSSLDSGVMADRSAAKYFSSYAYEDSEEQDHVAAVGFAGDSMGATAEKPADVTKPADSRRVPSGVRCFAPSTYNEEVLRAWNYLSSGH